MSAVVDNDQRARLRLTRHRLARLGAVGPRYTLTAPVTVRCEVDLLHAVAGGTDAASRSAKTTAFRTLVTEV